MGQAARQIGSRHRSQCAAPPVRGRRSASGQRGDLSAAGREAIVVRADFDPDGIVGRHTHPGEESSYILDGTVVLEIVGKPPVTLKTGDVVFIPAGVVHAARNIGKDKASVIATYIVEKGKSVATMVK